VPARYCMKFSFFTWIQQHRNFLAWMGGGTITVAALFGFLGYFWLPGFLKTRLEAALGNALRRPVSIKQISVSPYRLSVLVEGFQAGDVLSVESLQVSFSSASLFRRIPVVSRLDIRKPELRLVRESSDRLNVSDVLNTWSAKPEGAPPQFSVSNITLTRGRVEWVDRVAGGTQVISEIALGIPFVANVPSQVDVFIQPRFSARLNGSPISLDGKIRPFNASQDATIQLDLESFNLAALARYVKLPVAVHAAQCDAHIQIRFHRRPDAEPALSIEGDSALHDVDLEIGQQRFAFARFEMTGINTEPFSRRISARKAILRQPTWKLFRNKHGLIDFGRPDAARSHGAESGTQSTAGDWSWSLDRFELGDGDVRYEDATIRPAAPLYVSAVALQAGPLGNGRREPIALALDATVNEHGSIKATGTTALDGNTELGLKLKDVDLVALQGWLADRLNVVLTRGSMSYEGNARLIAENLQASGNLTLREFNVLDRVNAEDLLRWNSLSLSNVVFTADPFSLRTGDVVLHDFYAKAVINPQGRLNLKDIVRETKPAAAEPSRPAPASAVRIGSVTLDEGTINFSDRYIKPNYSARITGLAGRIGALAAGTSSPVELRGKVERTAPLEISGSMDPFSTPLGLDLRATARGIDLPSFSAYSGRYVGYAIEKGKFSMDVSYKVDKGELVAENKLFLDQLTFGDKVQSKDAIKLPIKLAVALLKNSRGEIDINLPIRGSLGDPQFSLSGIILKVMLNLVTKAVTKPFALLGSLFGKGKDLSEVSFAPGTASLSPEIEEHLQSLAKAMGDRPGLTLEVTGLADPTTDREALRQVLLERKLRARKLSDEAREGKTGTLKEVSLSAEERQIYLARIFTEEIKNGSSDSTGVVLNLPPGEMEKQLLAGISVGESELSNLADERGQRVQAWLADKGGVRPERVFLLASKIGLKKGDAGGSLVQFSLRQ
jgi:uncharacterized protein involved in outer membrane biogenesis